MEHFKNDYDKKTHEDNEHKTDPPRVGIMTFFDVENYGAVLQAYALCIAVHKLGFSAEDIRFKELNNDKATPLYKRVATVLKLSKGHLLKYLKTREMSRATTRSFMEFRNEYLKQSRLAYYSLEDLERYEDLYDAYITGSDMVWSDIGQNLDAYFLRFTDYDKRIAYSPSLTGTDGLDAKRKAYYRERIEGMKYLSIREKSGQEFIDKECGRNAIWTVDPTLLLDQNMWIEQLQIESHHEKPYILVYMFQGASTIKSAIKLIAETGKMDIRHIPMSVEERWQEHSRNKKNLFGPRQFVEMFSNASFIITNSYHGLLFSLIFNKPFVLFHREHGNRWSKHEKRMESLLEELHLEYRFLDPTQGIEPSMLQLDYSEINSVVNRKREESLNYLNSALLSATSTQLTHDQIKYRIDKLSKYDCSGCGVCVNSCRVNAITMVKDEEGFLYPHIDNDKCTNCQVCATLCPAINPVNLNYPKMVYGGFSTLPEQKNSASGGAFYTIAKNFIENLGGIVFGAFYDDTQNLCHHIEIRNTVELYKLQNSKYMQSILDDTFGKIKELLSKGNRVLFSGCPCQVAGLKKYLGKEQKGLYTIDIVCHGVPNGSLWDKDVNYLNSRYGIINKVTFRNKRNEKKSRSAFELGFTTGDEDHAKQHYIPVHDDAYYSLFARNASFRMSCYYCKYAQSDRCGDITLGDHDSWRDYPDFYPEKAKSCIMINTEKGIELWENSRWMFTYHKINYENEVKINTTLKTPSPLSATRNGIYSDIKNLSDKAFYNKYAYNRSFIGNAKKAVKKIIGRS